MGTVITFSNQKGGVAKTTSAVMTAGELTSRGKRVLLVDTDPQANATEYTYSQRTKLKYSPHDLIVDADLDTDDVIVSTDFGDLIPSSYKLYDADKAYSSPIVMKEIVDLVKDDYDYVVIDTPPNLGWLQIASLMATDYVVIPSKATKQSVQGIETLLNTIDNVRETNQNVQLAGFLFTMSDSRVLAVKFVSTEVEKVAANVGCKIFSHQIRTAQGLFGEAELRRENVFTKKKRNNAINDYRGFVDELLEVIDNGETKQPVR